MSDNINKIELYNEMGSTGLNRYGTQVDEEFLPALKGSRAAKMYSEMEDNEPMLGAYMNTMENLVRQVYSSVKQAGNTEQDIEAATFLDSCLYDMSYSWGDTISEILSFIKYGWAYTEIVYKIRRGNDTNNSKLKSKYDDGRIGWRKFAIRAQETLDGWGFDENGGITGMYQTAMPSFNTKFIPIEKALLFRRRSRKNNPEGRSDFRSAYKSYYYKKNYEAYEGIGLEKDLVGVPVLYAPSEILNSDDDKDKALVRSLQKLLKGLKKGEQTYIMLPQIADEKGNQRYKLELLSVNRGSRQFDTDQLIRRLESRIAMVCLMDFLTIGHDKVGAYNANESKVDLFKSALNTTLDQIYEVINIHAVPRLFKLNNFQKLTDYPIITHSKTDKVDLDILGNYIKNIADAGGIQLSGDYNVENYLRQIADLPNRPDFADGKEIKVDNN